MNDMGWMARLLKRFQRRDAKTPAWVSPQFLAVVACLGSVGLAVALLSEQPLESSSSESAPLQREYVGYSYDELVSLQFRFSDCLLECLVESQWEAWEASHPNVEIVEKRPVYERGIQVGYEVVYR